MYVRCSYHAVYSLCNSTSTTGRVPNHGREAHIPGYPGMEAVKGGRRLILAGLIRGSQLSSM
jgi:hypothetical protein